MRIRAVAAVCVLAAVVPAPLAAAREPATGARILPILRTTGLAGTGTAVAVVDVETGKLVFRRNAWRRLIPASNEKLFTSAGALVKLGPGFRFTTTVVGTGQLVGRTWRGDLFVVGSGDPTLTRGDLVALARRLHRAGIRRVSGRIFGDETLFDRVRYGPRWETRFYGIESPPLSGLTVDRNVGPTGHVLPNPAGYAARTLRKALTVQGVAVRRKPGTRKAPPTARVLVSIASPPLWKIVRYMDQWSDNFTAEMLVKAVGAYAGGGGTTKAGIAVEREVLADLIGAEATLLALVDGSGLSRANRATATSLARLLAAAASDATLGPALDGALAVAGVNGTLARRPIGPTGVSRVRAKTGTLNGVSSLSGYVTARATGRRYAFSILMNGRGLSSWQAHTAQDRIVASLAGGG
jgi:D-alanyl-D-alanine carboxypeptidase/D-alanyl-D-alanine-endopeptidase (penicillin-binding protein 4)